MFPADLSVTLADYWRGKSGRRGQTSALRSRERVRAPGAGLEPATFRLTAGRAASCATPDGDLQDAPTESGYATMAQTIRVRIQPCASASISALPWPVTVNAVGALGGR